MNIPFDKIYIISFVLNKEKREKIKYILDNILQINNYEFIYGIDIYSMKNLLYDKNKHQIYKNSSDEYNIHGISCGLAHYTALQHAKVNNFNKILIIEDDMLFINDLSYIEYVFNNYPNNADIIKFNSTLFDDINIINNEIIDKYYVKGWIGSGSTCYGIYNQKTINNMIESYINKSIIADSYEIMDPNYNMYSLIKMICIDPSQNLKFYTYNKDKDLTFDYTNILT